MKISQRVLEHRFVCTEIVIVPHSYVLFTYDNWMLPRREVRWTVLATSGSVLLVIMFDIFFILIRCKPYVLLEYRISKQNKEEKS